MNETSAVIACVAIASVLTLALGLANHIPIVNRYATWLRVKIERREIP